LRLKHATVGASVGVAPSKRFENLRDEHHAQPLMTQFPGILPRAKSITSDGANDRVGFAQNAQYVLNIARYEHIRQAFARFYSKTRAN
jgi:hypothetical protein